MGQEKISKVQVENIDTSSSLISHLTSNRTLCPPIDGKEDSQEQTHVRSAKRTAVKSELGCRGNDGVVC